MSKKSVVIVGAGVAGMASAISLARNGFDVTVFEKNSQSGGRCSQIVHDGHRFDIGATILLMPSIYREVFASLGLNFDECFELKDLPIIYKLYFGNGEQLIFSKDDAVMKPQLEAMEPGSFSRYKAYIETGYTFFCDAYKNLLARNFYSLFEFTTPGNMIMLVRLKTYQMIQKIKPFVEPRYQLSLEIIFDLYLMVFERINPYSGVFTTAELNPTPY